MITGLTRAVTYNEAGYDRLARLELVEDLIKGEYVRIQQSWEPLALPALPALDTSRAIETDLRQDRSNPVNTCGHSHRPYSSLGHHDRGS